MLGQASCVPSLTTGVALEIMTPSATAHTAWTLPAVADCPVASIITDL